MRFPAIGAAVFWTALAALGLAVGASSVDVMAEHFQEGGSVENISAALLLAAAVLLVLLYPLSSHLHLAVIALLLMEREVDASLLPLGHPLRVAQDWIESALLHNPLFVAALGVWLVYAGVRHGWPALRGAWRHGSAVPGILAMAVGFAACGQIAGEWAKHTAEALSETAYLQLMIVEELSELYFSVGILAAVLVGWRQSHALRNAR